MAFWKKNVSKILNRRKNKFSSINQLPNNPNVIINATFNIGDYLSLSPIIESLKSQWTDVNIIVLCTIKNEDVVKNDTRVNYVCLPPKNKWFKYPSKLKEHIGKTVSIDLLIEPSSLDVPYRSIIGAALKPDLTIGVEHNDYSCIQKPSIKLELKDSSQAEFYSTMMFEYGFKKVKGEFKVFEDKANNLRMNEILEKRNISDYLVFNPFASTKNRSLEVIKSKEIIKLLNKKGFNCLFILPSYIKNKDYWKSELKPYCTVFSVNSINDSIYLVKKAKSVVSVDTAIIHIASSYNIPTIGLYRDKVINSKRWHPQSSKSHIGLLSGEVNDIINTSIFDDPTC